jgi:hypothetical protein
MSWYQLGANPWQFRRVISVDNTAGTPGAPIDVTHTLLPDDDEFWNNVQSAGQDIRVCDSDGRTLQTYDLDSFSTSTRSGTIEVDNWTPPGVKMSALYLYFGNSSASTAATTFSPSSAKSGYIELGRPNARTFRVRPERPGDAKARSQFVKGANESVYVDFDFSAMLERAIVPGRGRMLWEEISYISSTTVEAAGVDQAAMHVATNDRICDGGRVRVWVTGGTSGTTYTVVCKIVTARPGGSPSGRTLEARARLYVQNVTE